jgi:hypothetical protein
LAFLKRKEKAYEGFKVSGQIFGTDWMVKEKVFELRFIIFCHDGSVSDPDYLIPNPDPSFRLNTDPDPTRIQGFDDQNWKKFTS